MPTLPHEVICEIMDNLPQEDFFAFINAMCTEKTFILDLCKLRARKIVTAAGQYLPRERVKARTIYELHRQSLRVAFRTLLVFTHGIEFFDITYAPDRREYHEWFPSGLPLDFYLEWKEHLSPSVTTIANFLNGHSVRISCGCPLCNAYIGLINSRPYPHFTWDHGVMIFKKNPLNHTQIQPLYVSARGSQEWENLRLNLSPNSVNSMETYVKVDVVAADYQSILINNYVVIETEYNG
jgi:hypothetical protein